jgi:hypothetical protein
VREYQTAVKAALTAAAGAVPVYDLGAVPTSPATPYMVLSTDSGLPLNRRVGATSTSRLVRAAVQFFGRTYAEVAICAEKADAALEGRSLTVAGKTVRSRRDVTATVGRDPDAGGLLYGMHAYTFARSTT